MQTTSLSVWFNLSGNSGADKFAVFLLWFLQWFHSKSISNWVHWFEYNLQTLQQASQVIHWHTLTYTVMDSLKSQGTGKIFMKWKFFKIDYQLILLPSIERLIRRSLLVDRMECTWSTVGSLSVSVRRRQASRSIQEHRRTTCSFRFLEILT